MPKQGYVYILTNKRNGTLYIGVTSDLIRRIWEHREAGGSKFTDRYHLKRLVYFEVFEDIVCAIAREKQLKAWRRDWKTALGEESNPDWDDLYPTIIK